jgi:hypothetical protein
MIRTAGHIRCLLSETDSQLENRRTVYWQDDARVSRQFYSICSKICSLPESLECSDCVIGEAYGAVANVEG